ALKTTKLPGLVSSCRQRPNTVTVKLHDAVLPPPVAEQLTVVVSTGKGDPDGGVLLRNPTHGSGWIVQAKPTTNANGFLRIPPTAVGGSFKSCLLNGASTNR